MTTRAPLNVHSLAPSSYSIRVAPVTSSGGRGTGAAIRCGEDPGEGPLRGGGGAAAVARDPGHQPNPATIRSTAAAVPALLIPAGPPCRRLPDRRVDVTKELCLTQCGVDDHPVGVHGGVTMEQAVVADHGDG